MDRIIYKFQRDMLNGEKIHVSKGRRVHSYEKHWHSYFEIICYCRCSGSSILNGKTYPITDHCLFLLTPKDFHEIYVEEGTEPEYYVISFSEQIIDDTLFSQVSKGPVYISGSPAWLEDQIQNLYRIFKTHNTHREAYLRHLFNCVLIEVLEHGSSLSHSVADIHPMIRQSISLMLADPVAPYSLAEFSGRFNVSTTYFSRLFHENAGVSFKRYQTLLRIEYSKRLLEEKQLPIIDVGCECGFNTPSQFIRAFKGLTGMTPSEYRHSRVVSEP